MMLLADRNAQQSSTGHLSVTQSMVAPVEHVQVSLETPAGRIIAEVAVPTTDVPATAIVPLMRSLGHQSQELAEAQMLAQGASVSCRQGCAACCRMLVPLSVPEAFALQASIERLSEEHQTRLRGRLVDAKQHLQEHGIWTVLEEVAESVSPPSDEALEPLNQAYYALRMPCPFLEEEQCSIYEDRPAACRELLVTSPADWCQDMTNPHIRPVPVSLRISTALGLLWADLTGTAARLIPLPVALDWALRHREGRRLTWPGTVLLDKALDKLWRLLGQQLPWKEGPEAKL